MQFKLIMMEKCGTNEGLGIETDALLGGPRSQAERNNLGSMEVEDISDGIGLDSPGPRASVHGSRSSGLSHESFDPLMRPCHSLRLNCSLILGERMKESSQKDIKIFTHCGGMEAV